VSPRRRIESATPLTNDPLWYKDAIIYQTHVRAFCDASGDGVGDFAGLVTRLDYLQDLGVTALWLLPFYPSPLRDDGYDIADYTGVHPLYGNLADFKLFLREAHRRGLRVITELVINHTSDQHAWFQKARHAPPGSTARNFYVWSDTPDRYKEARIIFKDFETSNWAWDPVARAYFWHRFYSHQPDLNFDNPAVHKAVFDVMDFWLRMGIDGMRLDAVPYLYERDGTNCENLPETHAFLKELRRHVDEHFPGRMLLAEANQWPEDAVAYFGAGDECHMAFHFPVMPRLFMAIRMEDRFPVLDILHQTPPIPETAQWAMFLRNHDELTLEMVTDEDRDYMYRTYAQDPQARINLGIRRRLAPLLENHRGKIELMNALLFSLPGTPVIYYGDEIGMGDNIYLGDRNGVRTPMQWNAERNAGFSRANPQRLYFPLILDPPYHYEALNVEAQQHNPNSLLWWFKRMIALRRQYRAFGRGSLEFLTPDNGKVLAFVRRYTPHPQPLAPEGRGEQTSAPLPSGERGRGEGEERILVVANLSRLMQHVELDLNAFKGLVPVEMLGRTPLPAVGDRPYFLTLGPYAFYWFSLEPQPHPVFVAPPAERELPVLEAAGDWQAVLQGPARAALEEALPSYLRQCGWFREKARQTEAAMILETIPLTNHGSNGQLVLLQVEYTEQNPETYLVPMAFAPAPRAEEVRRELPQSVIARLRVTGPPGGDGTIAVEGILYDPLGDRPFSEMLFESIARRRHFKRSGGEVVASRTRAFPQLPASEFHAAPVPLRAEQHNSLVFFDDRFVLKAFRRVEEGVNPELALARFLTEKVGFEYTPPLLGALEYRRSWGEPLSLAVLYRFVPNQGDGWRLALDALGRYYEQALAARDRSPEPPLPRRLFLDLVREEVPELARETIGSYLEAARLLGQRTAELHLALASRTDDPAFTPEPFSTLYQRSLYQTMRTQSRRTIELLRKRVQDLPEPVQRDGPRLLSLEPELLKRISRIRERKINALRTRCHGDYHLAQVLWLGKDWMIIDLEGDPSRPFGVRWLKRSPLRDVASMVRSFHYAALCALTQGPIRPEDQAVLEPWVRFWHQWVATTFLKAYLETASRGSFLPSSREELDVVLDFYLVKRAVNELHYELTYHPDRVRVPLQGLLHLLEGRD
jgi:maltose alpha-D-glucosyltransferase/alpha-amylase